MPRMTAGRKLLAFLLVFTTLYALPIGAQSNTTERLKQRVQGLHATGKRVQLKLSDQTVLHGRIVQVGTDSFTVRLADGTQEAVIPFAQVTDVRNVGSGHTKAILIVLAAAGATVLLLCAAPYPIGFLCRKDPS